MIQHFKYSSLVFLFCISCRTTDRINSVPPTTMIITSYTNANMLAPGVKVEDFEVSNPLVDKLLAIETSIANRTDQLNRERDRRGKLLIELGLFGVSNCATTTPVTTLEIELIGSPTDDVDVSTLRQNSNISVESGQANFKVTMGSADGKNIAIFLFDQIKSGDIGGGRKPVLIPNNLTVSQIQMVEVEKLNPSYSIQDTCLGASGCTNGRIIHEVFRFNLTGVNIYVNNNPIYENQYVNSVLAQESSSSDVNKNVGLIWKDTNVQLGQDFQSFLAKCPQ